MISDEVKQDLNAAAVEVFGTMYFTPVELLPELPEPDRWQLEECYVQSSIGFTGPTRASLSFYFPRSLGVSIAGGFLGVGEGEVTDQQLVDTMQEAANMIVGNLLGRIDPGGECCLGIPSAELVHGFSPKTDGAQEGDLMAFVSDFGLLWLIFTPE